VSYATVKSDPWKKGLQVRRKRTGLWTAKQWSLLVATAQSEVGFTWTQTNLKKYRIGPETLAIIVEFNGRQSNDTR